MTVSAEAITTTLQIPADVHAAIQEIAERTGRSVGDVANEMLSEAIRMRRVPGIVFADEPSGRRPWIAGTGLELFEILDAYRNMGEDWNSLRKAFHWIDERQLQLAFAYAKIYSDEVEEWFREADGWTIEDLWEKHPETRPPGR